MNIFSPYNTINHAQGEKIELELPNWRKKFYYITFRIFPFILLAININAFVFAYRDIPAFFGITLGICIPFICVVMLFKKYPIVIKISNDYIEVNRNTIKGNETIKFSVSSIKKITCKIRGGRNGGTFFFLHTINDYKAEFLTIPPLNMEKEKTTAIIAELEKITGIEVKQV
ncbi:MAG: hypothetical protein KF781_06355 [Chitinophagaceae bacterium]|nr:hypothetical protein [Chitinophagaceae bacterium]MCW5904157.1 hypothetical protein [Chitinophagaceae bacterium]